MIIITLQNFRVLHMTFTLSVFAVGVTEVERKTLQYTLDHMKYTPKAGNDPQHVKLHITYDTWLVVNPPWLWLRFILDDLNMTKHDKTSICFPFPKIRLFPKAEE